MMMMECLNQSLSWRARTTFHTCTSTSTQPHTSTFLPPWKVVVYIYTLITRVGSW